MQIFEDAYVSISSDGFDGDFVATIGRQDDATLINVIKKHWDGLEPSTAELETIELPFTGVPTSTHFRMFNNFFRSDHANFWKFNMTAVFLTDTGEEFRFGKT